MCSFESQKLTKGFGTLTVSCDNCDKEFSKKSIEIQKTSHNFCSRSCSATYHNKHKTTGYRRSKLEKYLEERIRQEFPDIEFETNCRSVIGYELDFYFPTLKLAVEVNGPIHYQPIYSDVRFERTKAIDIEKQNQCVSCGVTLVVVPNLKPFSPALGERVLRALNLEGSREIESLSSG